MIFKIVAQPIPLKFVWAVTKLQTNHVTGRTSPFICWLLVLSICGTRRRGEERRRFSHAPTSGSRGILRGEEVVAPSRRERRSELQVPACTANAGLVREGTYLFSSQRLRWFQVQNASAFGMTALPPLLLFSSKKKHIANLTEPSLKEQSDI